MHVTELFIKEDSASDRLVRDDAKRVIKALESRRDEALTPGAVMIDTSLKRQIAFPTAYMSSGIPNLAVGLVCGASFPFLIDLRSRESTLPKTVKFMIAYPYGRFSDVHQLLGGLPDSLESSVSAAKKLLPPRAHYLIGQVQDVPTFTHEFTHYSDFMRAASRDRTLKPSTIATHGEQYYINTPLERNAYYNGALATFDKKPPAFWRRPFKDVLRDLWALTHTEFDGLTPGNRQRLIGRFYAVWQKRRASGILRPA